MNIYFLYISAMIFATIGLIFSLSLKFLEKKIGLKNAIITFVIIIVPELLCAYIFNIIIMH
ncbi:hypothetical protein DY048_04795 [Apilactobacillus timberlakei]|uniref:Uncharacterized protein n=1 Tax=Apilactobacillus timberlakei TaxID=2008380 RepID=A0ABY2YX14_9LACO|nr:hypothetical protein DY048_04795 [Apilactobacillus timberlakei]TPR16521.1 hypothetical protein DY052_02885 [Apilactobacillus timberlakei]